MSEYQDGPLRARWRLPVRTAVAAAACVASAVLAIATTVGPAAAGPAGRAR